MSREKKTLYMETTEVPAERTAAEISAVLIRAGATQIATDYDAGKIKGLRWTMRVPGRGEILFAMPARVEPIFRIFEKRATWGVDRQKLRAKAERVAWRQLLRWVQAQMAMIECGMAEASEVFFPYIQEPTSGRTIYELAKDSGFKLLAPPEKPQ